MDAHTAALIAIAIFALLVIFLSLRFRDRLKGGIKGPLGTEVNFEASNPQTPSTPSVRMDGVKSHAGSIQAIDRTGDGVDVRNAEAYGDVNATSDPHPKAEPPA
ncbi:MAG: hypothetical protein ABIS20_15135 [Thermoanaerobaculia bacterium]